jgi:hypothetical protein
MTGCLSGHIYSPPLAILAMVQQPMSSQRFAASVWGSPLSVAYITYIIYIDLQKYDDHALLLTVQILAEKPNKVTPQTFQPGPEQLEAARALLNSLSGVQRSAVPAPCLPPTSNSEYGFDHNPLMEPNPAFQFSKTNCDITAYADAYCAFSNGVSPFARPLAGTKTQRKG